MTLSTRIGLGLSAALVSLGLALAPAAYAQDKMGMDKGSTSGAMKKDSSHDTMKKDSMSHDAMQKGDGMKKDDAMSKKDDAMKKN